MDVSRVITIISAALAAFGIFLIFQGGIELANDRRQGRPSTGGQWWQIIEGVIFTVLGGMLATILAPVLSA